MNIVKQYLDIVSHLEFRNINCQICLVIYDPITGYVNFRAYSNTKDLDYMQLAEKVVEFNEFKFGDNTLELVLFINQAEDCYILPQVEND